MEKVLDYISTTKKDEGGQVHVKQEEVQAHNGKKVNVNRIPAKDEYIYIWPKVDGCFIYQRRNGQFPFTTIKEIRQVSIRLNLCQFNVRPHRQKVWEEMGHE